MAKINNWTREQTIIALNLYCKIPFNKVSSTHPDILNIAKIIGRSANSVKMKIGNFGSFDPELKKRGIVGLTNTSRLDKSVWEEFNNDWENLSYKSELLISEFTKKPLEKIANIDIKDLPEGIDRERLIKSRVNQSFFRSTILSSYNFKCCITGLSVKELLVASHIIPWAENEKLRLNPHNGLCLNAIHDKAYDKYLIAVTPDYAIKISSKILGGKHIDAVKDIFIKYHNEKIILPERFVPSKEYLDKHYQKFLKEN